jgi:hypothetical protein
MRERNLDLEAYLEGVEGFERRRLRGGTGEVFVQQNGALYMRGRS